MSSYRVVRFYFNGEPYRRRILARGLTLEQAQEHYNDPETSSETALTVRAMERTAKLGPWFDGYESEGHDE